jgi:hypothetical protein
MNKKMFAAVQAAAAAALLLASCATFEGSAAKATPDEKAISRGTTAWNQKGPAAAKPFWNEIKDKTARETYTGYVDAFNSGSKYLTEAESAKAGDDARILASFEKAQKAFADLPKELELPDETRASGIAIAEGRMRSLISADKLSKARELGKAAVRTFGSSEAIEAMNAEVDVISASRKREADADAVLDKAREAVDFDAKIAGIDTATGAYARAESLLAGDASKANVSKIQSVVREASKLRKKRQDLLVEREKLLREQAYLYKERIGEEFARVPDKDKVGNMTLEELLKHQESVKANVEMAYDEMNRFAARYPQVADPEMMAEIEEQKKDLDVKIAQVNAEIRTAKEIASRGKVVMPIMIGLFNPQPGTAAEAKKSRPAVFQAKGVKENDYWWGMVSIPKGTMNDLVVTVNDSRAVRVFRDNTKSGTLIEKSKMKDLVNRGYKIGNSWPVLNAGEQLTTDKYFFEVQKGKTPSYEGEVVVYSSFIMRMR